MGAYLGSWEEPPNPDTLTVNILNQNRPNPFRNNTAISYQIFSPRQAEYVTLFVFNIRGQLVRTLVDEEKTNGQYFVYWNGRNDADKAVPSGYYFYRLKVGSEYTKTLKMLWLRPLITTGD